MVCVVDVVVGGDMDSGAGGGVGVDVCDVVGNNGGDVVGVVVVGGRGGCCGGGGVL